MNKQKKTAGSGNSTTAKKKSSKSIIDEPIDIVNMSGAEIVRRSEEPDTPYCTMEIDKASNIRQCYGYKNNRGGEKR